MDVPPLPAVFVCPSVVCLCVARAVTRAGLRVWRAVDATLAKHQVYPLSERLVLSSLKRDAGDIALM